MNKDDVNDGLNDDTEDSEEVDNVTLSWLLRKLSNIAKYESSQTPKLIQKVGSSTLGSFFLGFIFLFIFEVINDYVFTAFECISLDCCDCFSSWQ